MEVMINLENKILSYMNLEEMDVYWEKAKQQVGE